MGILRRFLSHSQQQNLLLAQNAVEVEESNRKLTTAILAMGCVMLVPFLIISLSVDSYKPLSTVYFILSAVLLLLLLLFPRLRQRFPCAYILYAGYALMIVYSIYTSAFITPNYISVIILFFLFQIPIIVIDKNWRINLIVLLFAAVYLLVAIPNKAPFLRADEVLNCLLFTVFGLGLGHHLRSARLENLELKRQALLREKTDELTGLNNRKSLFERLGTLEALRETGVPAGLLMIDIDQFKPFNDTYGHQAGDRCLREIGACLLTFGRKTEVEFFRYGGEEFVGIVLHRTAEELLEIGTRLNRAVSDLRFPHSTSATGFVTVSVGLSLTAGAPPSKYEQLALSQADVALYAAKARGRNCTVAYAEGMTIENAATESLKRR